MKIIIVGLGRTGILLSEQVSKENHDVVVVDSNKKLVDEITDKYNVTGICGSGASKNVMVSAGVANADVVVALTPVDEVNMMCCLLAKKCGARYTATRIYGDEFSKDRKYFNEEFGIDYIINSKYDTANEIIRQIGLPGAVKADAFFSNDTVSFRLTINKGSELIGKNLFEVRKFFQTDLIVGAVLRHDKVYIPNGEYIVSEDDELSIIATREGLLNVVSKIGLERKEARKIFIFGGGSIGQYLAEKLLAEKKSVTIFESDKTRCIELSEKYEKAEIIFSEYTDSEVLIQDGIKSADVCVTLTGSDEKNLVISLFAWSCGVESIVTKVEQPSYEKLLNKTNMDITISPIVIAVDRLMSFIRNVTVYNAEGNDINKIYTIASGKADAIEFIAYDNFVLKDVAFKDKKFKIKKDTIIAAIIRDDKVIVPNGDSSIKPNDHVIVIAKANHGYNTINEIFK